MKSTAQEKLKNKISKGLHICVGLDSDITKIPAHLKTLKNPILEFNKSIIEATLHGAAAYKINFAFYECLGIEGIKILEETLSLIPEDILIIADAKRGDIGNTSMKYAESVYDYFKCDSVTINPYMGFDSVEPFIEFKDKINFVLGLTSNNSALDFEKQKLSNNKYLYQKVIEQVNDWNVNNNCGLVFGATKLDELENNINSFKNMPILLPGVGAQGGSLEGVVNTFYKHSKENFIINISRGILYCDSSENYSEKVKEVLNNYNTEIEKIIL